MLLAVTFSVLLDVYCTYMFVKVARSNARKMLAVSASTAMRSGGKGACRTRGFAVLNTTSWKCRQLCARYLIFGLHAPHTRTGLVTRHSARHSSRLTGVDNSDDKAAISSLPTQCAGSPSGLPGQMCFYSDRGAEP